MHINNANSVHPQYMNFAGTSPMISKFTPPTFTPTTVHSMHGTTADSSYVPAPVLLIARPTQQPSMPIGLNANGYVTHESLALPAMAQSQPSAAVSVQPTANINGYLPWNAITAAALSAAADAAAVAAAVAAADGDASVDYVNGTNDESSTAATTDDSVSKDGSSKHSAPAAATRTSVGDQRTNAADTVAAAVTGISGKCAVQ